MDCRVLKCSAAAIVLAAFAQVSFAAETKTETLTIPPEKDSASFSFQLNSQEKISFSFKDAKGKKLKGISFTPKEEKREINKLPPEFAAVKLENHYFAVGGLGLNYYVRPKTAHYNAKEINKIAKGVGKLLPEWQKMPDATKKNVPMDIRFDGRVSRIYIDGRYAFSTTEKISTVEVEGPQSYILSRWEPYSNLPLCYDDFEVLDVGVTGVAEAMKEGVSTLKPGKQFIKNIPFVITPPEKSSDIALTGNTFGKSGLDENMFFARDTFHALKEAQVMSVPAGYYHKIHLIFALDPAAEKEKKLTIKVGRSTRFGRTSPVGYTDIVLPDNEKEFPKNIKKIGSVKVKGEERPLYLGTFPLALGDYMGLMEPDIKPDAYGRGHTSPYIDIEIFGPRIIKTAAYVSSHLMPTGKDSAFNLFGATLEKSPASLRLKPAQPASVFLEDEKPETRVTIAAKDAGNYKLELKILSLRDCALKPAIYDWDENSERPLRTIVEEVNLQAGTEKSFDLDLTMPRKGHYATRLNLYRDGERILTHVGGFVLLGKPDRRATKEESPYSIWWMAGVHKTWSDASKAYDLMNRKLGIHKFSYAPFRYMSKEDEKKLTAEGIDFQPAQMINRHIPSNLQDDEEKMTEWIDKTYTPLWNRYPTVRSALIFHESYGDATPPEVYGIKKELTEKEKERDLRYVRMANALSKWYRKNHPNVKLVFGNNTSSTAILAALLRSGFDPKYIDRIGLETPGQGCMPERIWQGGVQGQLYMKELLRYYKLDIPLTECYEYTARPARLIGYSYEYQIRDALMSYANGCDQLTIGGLQTPGNAYVQSIWGSGGLLQPEPYRYPMPAVAAVFTLVNVLDQSAFVRAVPTGSKSVYLQEYSRKRGDYVYAAWAPVGKNTVRFNFPEDAHIEAVDLYGERKKVPLCSFTKTIGTAPFYLISSKKIIGSSVVKRTYAPMPPEMKVVAHLASTEDVLVVERPFYPQTDFHYVNGKFTVTQVADNEKGKCLEIKLDKKGALSPLKTEYFKLKLLNRPIVHDNLDWIGIWVKGDSGWGKISFDITGADGVKMVSDGTWHDFDCQMTINHDGWRFMKIPFDKMDSAILNPSLGNRWNRTTPNKLTKIHYPVTITAVNVALRRVAPDPVDWVDVPACIRIKDLAVSGSEKIDYRQVQSPSSELLTRLNESGLRDLILPDDFCHAEKAEIVDCPKSGRREAYFSGGTIVNGYKPFIQKGSFSIELCFRIPAKSRSIIWFYIGSESFTLSTANKDKRFEVLAEQFVTARCVVKDGRMKVIIDGTERASVALDSVKSMRIACKDVYVSYAAICDNDLSSTAEAQTSEVGATNAKDQGSQVEAELQRK